MIGDLFHLWTFWRWWILEDDYNCYYYLDTSLEGLDYGKNRIENRLLDTLINLSLVLFKYYSQD